MKISILTPIVGGARTARTQNHNEPNRSASPKSWSKSNNLNFQLLEKTREKLV